MPDPALKPHAAHAHAWRALRVAFLAVSAVFALQVLPWRASAMLLPRLSPFLSLCSALAVRRATTGVLLALPLLILGLLRARWFCGHLCPTGYCASVVSRVRRGGRSRYKRFPNLGPWLVLLGLGGAAAGYPLFLWLDPLSIFNGFFGAWHRPLLLVNLLPAAGFVVLLLANLLVPNLWCHRLCPLGATQDILSRWGREVRDAAATARPEGRALGRRSFLGVLVGGAAGLAARRVLGRSTPPVRPPGAAREDMFGGLCARCGNCVRACPYAIIRPDVGQSGLAGLLTPVIDQSEQYCVEFCHECNKVCPTGAIAHLTLDEKRHTAIGLAEVTRSRCLAWAYGAHCMVCQEFCPYLAIRAEVHNGVNCPLVDPEVCRGCGACHTQCPARPLKAINVHGLPQKRAKPLPSFESASANETET